MRSQLQNDCYRASHVERPHGRRRPVRPGASRSCRPDGRRCAQLGGCDQLGGRRSCERSPAQRLGPVGAPNGLLMVQAGCSGAAPADVVQSMLDHQHRPFRSAWRHSSASASCAGRRLSCSGSRTRRCLQQPHGDSSRALTERIECESLRLPSGIGLEWRFQRRQAQQAALHAIWRAPLQAADRAGRGAWRRCRSCPRGLAALACSAVTPGVPYQARWAA